MDFARLGIPRGSTFAQGTATTVISAAKKLSVNIAGTIVEARATRDLTVAVGDIVILGRLRGQLIAFGRLMAAAPTAPITADDETPPPPQPVDIIGFTVMTPVETISYRDTFGWRNDNADIYQGQYGGYGNHIGCAFFGNKPRSLAGATILSAKLHAKRETGGVFAPQATTLRLVTQRTRPAGAPTLTGSGTAGPNLAVGGSDASIAIPVAFAQALVDGTAGALAIYVAGGTPYVRLAGRARYGAAFALTLKWIRST